MRRQATTAVLAAAASMYARHRPSSPPYEVDAQRCDGCQRFCQWDEFAEITKEADFTEHLQVYANTLLGHYPGTKSNSKKCRITANTT